MKFGIERFAADLCRDIGASVVSAHHANNFGDSPIETLFYSCFYHAIHVHPRYRHLSLGALEDARLTSRPDLEDVFVGFQVRVLDWPVDFMIQARSPFLSDALASLVVECDGHDFHERTKEQAARDRGRDRALQAAGFTVMRFTGSELYRDPMRCVREVLDWCLAATERS